MQESGADRLNKIEIKNLCFSYGKKEILKNLNLTITAKKPLVLLGESGFGKTTLLRLLLGFIKPDSGEILGIDKDTVISVLYQEDRLFPHLTVYKNLKLIKKNLSPSEAGALLGELNLKEEVLDKLPKELSGGMKRRVALARALIFPSELLLLDEPFQGLDEENRKAAIRALIKYRADRVLLVITHEAEDAVSLGADMVRIENISGKHGD